MVGVTINATFRVAEEDMEDFKSFIATATEMVREKERDDTIVYEFWESETGSGLFRVSEAYTAVEGLMNHFVNLGDLAAVGGRLLQVEELVLTGDIPDELVANFMVIGPEKVRIFKNLIASR
jgi:quinol monooxygenase YgiN